MKMRIRIKEKNKKAEMEDLIKIVLWVVFFLIAIGGIYFLVRYLTNQ